MQYWPTYQTQASAGAVQLAVPDIGKCEVTVLPAELEAHLPSAKEKVPPATQHSRSDYVARPTVPISNSTYANKQHANRAAYAHAQNPCVNASRAQLN